MQKSKQGFTLLELTLVLGILSIVSVGAIIGVNSIDRRTLTNAVLTLQADLHYAQRRAITEGRRYGIVFEPLNSRYRIINVDANLTVRTVYLPNGITLHTNRAQIIYLPRGTAFSGATITLLSRQHRQQLTANVGGGRIHIEDMTRA